MQVAGGRYIKVDIQREKAARYGLNIADVQQVVATAIGGMNVTQTIEGLERYPVNLRYPQDLRNSPEQLALLPIVTGTGQRIALADVANVYVEDGPPAIKSENARLNGWTFVDIDGVDIGSYVKEAMVVVADQVDLPAGYSLNWSGQYEYMLRAKAKLTYVVPLTLAIIIVLLYFNFRSFAEVAIIMGTLPLAMVGSIWLMYLLGYNFSVAVGVGFIALAGVAVEIGKVGADPGQVDEPINGAQQVVLRNMILKRELVEQRRLRLLPRSHHRRSSHPLQELNQPTALRSSASFSTKYARNHQVRMTVATTPSF